MRTKYAVVKIPGYNTIGELKNFWRINYVEFDTLYTLPEKYFTKTEALEEMKRMKKGN
jgi:hypothetical protein